LFGAPAGAQLDCFAPLAMTQVLAHLRQLMKHQQFQTFMVNALLSVVS
jgi:hypothetical protein